MFFLPAPAPIILAASWEDYQDVTDPAGEQRCQMCHLAAAQNPDAVFKQDYDQRQGVGCEACHGPGSSYMDPEIMSDREQFSAHGGIVPDKTTCQKCHRNPDRFDFATWWPKINH